MKLVIVFAALGCNTLLTAALSIYFNYITNKLPENMTIINFRDYQPESRSARGRIDKYSTRCDVNLWGAISVELMVYFMFVTWNEVLWIVVLLGGGCFSHDSRHQIRRH